MVVSAVMLVPVVLGTLVMVGLSVLALVQVVPPSRLKKSQ